MSEEKMKSLIELLLACITCMVIGAIGYAIGYSNGCQRGLKTANDWKEMYDKHINGQWDLIRERDSIYMMHFDNAINHLEHGEAN